jgi:hypothetical protein
VLEAAKPQFLKTKPWNIPQFQISLRQRKIKKTKHRYKRREVEYFSNFSRKSLHKRFILKTNKHTSITMIRKMKIPIILVGLMLYTIIFLSVTVSATTVSIQPSSQDSYISEWSSSSNNGGNDYILVNPHAGHAYRIVVKFDLSSIPSGSTVSTATLKLLYNHGTSETPAGRTYMAYRITQSWTEMGVTWERYDGTNSWATSGGDYTTSGGASSIFPSSYGWMSWDVTNIAKAWIETGEPNNGFLVKDDNESSFVGAIPQANFCSREWAESDKRPILEITYTEPAPSIESAVFTSPSTWTATDTFNVGDDVCVIGSDFLPDTEYEVQVVNDVDWTDGMTIPAYIAKASVPTDYDGEILDAYPVWNDATTGKYDIIVDVNDNNKYDEGIDALDDNDIQVTAGFFVIPEVAIGSITAAAAMFTALALYTYQKKHTTKQ